MRSIIGLVCVGALTACGPPAPISTEASAGDRAVPLSAEPSLVSPLGTPPPEGVESHAHTRSQLEAFLTAKEGHAVRILEAVAISGSQVDEYCGLSGTPDGQGEGRYFRVTVWSAANVEFELTSSDLKCDDGRQVVRDAKTIPWSVAQKEYLARLAPPEEASAPVTAISSSGGASMYGLIDRVSTYAVLVGRGVGCGVDVSGPVARVGAWLDAVAPPGSEAQTTLLPMFMQQSQYHASQQISGASPDNCSTVARAIKGHRWP